MDNTLLDSLLTIDQIFNYAKSGSDDTVYMIILKNIKTNTNKLKFGVNVFNIRKFKGQFILPSEISDGKYVGFVLENADLSNEFLNDNPSSFAKLSIKKVAQCFKPYLIPKVDAKYLNGCVISFENPKNEDFNKALERTEKIVRFLLKHTTGDIRIAIAEKEEKIKIFLLFDTLKNVNPMQLFPLNEDFQIFREFKPHKNSISRYFVPIGYVPIVPNNIYEKIGGIVIFNNIYKVSKQANFSTEIYTADILTNIFDENVIHFDNLYEFAQFELNDNKDISNSLNNLNYETFGTINVNISFEKIPNDSTFTQVDFLIKQKEPLEKQLRSINLSLKMISDFQNLSAAFFCYEKEVSRVITSLQMLDEQILKDIKVYLFLDKTDLPERNFFIFYGPIAYLPRMSIDYNRIFVEFPYWKNPIAEILVSLQFQPRPIFSLSERHITERLISSLVNSDELFQNILACPGEFFIILDPSKSFIKGFKLILPKSVREDFPIKPISFSELLKKLSYQTPVINIKWFGVKNVYEKNIEAIDSLITKTSEEFFNSVLGVLQENFSKIAQFDRTLSTVRNKLNSSLKDSEFIDVIKDFVRTLVNYKTDLKGLSETLQDIEKYLNELNGQEISKTETEVKESIERVSKILEKTLSSNLTNIKTLRQQLQETLSELDEIRTRIFQTMK